MTVVDSTPPTPTAELVLATSDVDVRPTAAVATTDALTEVARVSALARFDVLQQPLDGSFDRLARLAARWLDTPFASVTVVDSDHIWYKSQHGFDAPEQLDREPGLCVSAIANDGPYVLADAAADPVAMHNSLVSGDAGVRFYAAAPIVTSDGHRLGTVNVFDTVPRDVDPADVMVLIELAAVAMDELELRLSAMTTVRTERAARARAESDAAVIGGYAAVLQRTLLPPSLPAIGDLALASHYHAASPLQVGGDFYDVFSTGPDRWAFFLGDVQGHGAGAAAVTSLIRYTLRAAALHHESPVDGLVELNRVLMMDPDQKRFCTVLFGVITPDPRGGFRVTLATGGHPPALLLDSDSGEVHEIRSDTGMFVGALDNASFSACSFRLTHGQTLLLYTDGITEARPDGRTMFGEDGLADFVRSRAGRTPQRIVDDLAGLIPTLRPIDDIALLALGA